MSALSRLIVCRALLSITDESLAVPVNAARHSTAAQFPGICARVRYALDEAGHNDAPCHTALEWMYADWPHHSGSRAGFPVPSTKRGVSAQDCYYQMMGKEKLWDKNTRYGQLRWDLLKHMRRAAQAYVDDMAELAGSSNKEGDSIDE